MANTVLNLEIDGHSFNVRFPSVGDLLGIQSVQQTLTRGNYDAMASSRLAMPLALLDIVDAYAHFSVLCPDMMKKLQFSDITKIQPAEGKALVDVYKAQFAPWFKNITDQLFGKVDQKDQAQSDATGQ